jgi:hypothetical protein
MDWKERALSATPRDGDMLFKADHEGWEPDVDLHGLRDSGFAYARGYRLAAQAMAQRLLDDSGWEAEFLVFPVAFLYRHHVELMLKRLIVIGVFLDGRELTSVEKNHLRKHRLDLLWTILRPLLKSECSPSLDDLKGISHYIDQLHKVDPQSQSFRYAMSSKDEPALSSIPYINVGVFAEAMERLCNYLDGVDSQFDLHTDHRQEMLAYQAEFEEEMRAEYEADVLAEQAEYEAEIGAEYEGEMGAEQAQYEAEMRAEEAQHEAEVGAEYEVEIEAEHWNEE